MTRRVTELEEEISQSRHDLELNNKRIEHYKEMETVLQ